MCISPTPFAAFAALFVFHFSRHDHDDDDVVHRLFRRFPIDSTRSLLTSRSNASNLCNRKHPFASLIITPTEINRLFLLSKIDIYSSQSSIASC